jgi:hypothetical protein
MVWGSGIRDPRSGIRKKPIPDPGSRCQKAPNPGSRIRIRNTGLNCVRRQGVEPWIVIEFLITAKRTNYLAGKCHLLFKCRNLMYRIEYSNH